MGNLLNKNFSFDKSGQVKVASGLKANSQSTLFNRYNKMLPMVYLTDQKEATKNSSLSGSIYGTLVHSCQPCWKKLGGHFRAIGQEKRVTCPGNICTVTLLQGYSVGHERWKTICEMGGHFSGTLGNCVFTTSKPNVECNITKQ